MSLAQDPIISAKRGLNSEIFGYEQLLRAIGQALEREHLAGFELSASRDEFLVRVGPALNENLADKPSSRSNFQMLWDRLYNRGNKAVQLRYTLPDIQRLETEGRAQRGGSHRVPNGSSLSQEMRCLGACLDQKRARLIKLTHDGDLFVLEYESSLGNQMKESYDAKELYDMWVRRYMQRASRANQQIAAES